MTEAKQLSTNMPYREHYIFLKQWYFYLNLTLKVAMDVSEMWHPPFKWNNWYQH